MPHQHARDALLRALSALRLPLTALQLAGVIETVLDQIAQELQDAEMFRWISDNATISWDTAHENAQVCFPLKADFFDTIEDAVRKAMGDEPEDS
jgi:hypothetical protein